MTRFNERGVYIAEKGGENIGDLETYAGEAGGNFIKAADLPTKETVTKRVARAEWQDFQDGRKPVLHFKDGSAMVVNKTNTRILLDGSGIESLTDAVGIDITMQSQLVNFRGNLVPGIRVTNVENGAE